MDGQIDQISEDQQEKKPFDWPLAGIALGTVVLLAVTALTLAGKFTQLSLTELQQNWLQVGGFAVAIVAPIILSWRRAIRDGELPAKEMQPPKYQHISGWGAVFLLTIMALIVWLVLWAANTADGAPKIHSMWGLAVFGGLIIAFVFVATAPLLARASRLMGLTSRLKSIAQVLEGPVHALGHWLSAVDSVLVFAVAKAAAADRQRISLRYGVLLSTLFCCAVLGYCWDAPLGLLPLGCAFVIAFAISRRWVWIENDRELWMLNPHLPDGYINVGFEQNLRDEALVSFLSIFALVPLALRQLQMSAGDYGVELFSFSDNGNADSMLDWIAFYGTELAKSVPFVDWAEVYHVEGDAPVHIASPMGQHVLFAVRVLIDLVFLAALLQAISNAARDSQQRELFQNKQLDRLDPFTEPEAFRALVQRDKDNNSWTPREPQFREFPPYDPNRLVELSTDKDERIRAAANALIGRDGINKNSPVHKFAERTDEEHNDEEIKLLMNEVELTKTPNVFLLDTARKRLAKRYRLPEIRRRILDLIIALDPELIRADIFRARTDALLSAAVGDNREPTWPTRKLALETLERQLQGNQRVRAAFEQAAKYDQAGAIREYAEAVVKNQSPIA